MTDLNLKIIKSYGFPETITRPDHDDISLSIELPNGLELSCLTVCCNELCECDTLYGFDDFLEVKSKERLDELIAMTYEQIVNEVAMKNDKFVLLLTARYETKKNHKQ